MYIRTLCLLTLGVIAVNGHPGFASTKEKMLILLVDGVRHDYLTRDPELKGFPRIARHGSRAKYVEPIFPSNSYPNWYSIVTGLYAESHGFVQNYMYDSGMNDIFLMAPHENASHEHWWNKAEPLWTTAEKNSLKTSMYWWDGCQVAIRGVKPTKCLPYEPFWTWQTHNEDTEEALMDILSWFEISQDHRLALVYYEGVDAIGHYRGPDSEHVQNVVREIDGIIDRFQDELEKKNLSNSVNFLVVSDHGMSDTEPKRTAYVNLDDYNVTQDMELMLDKGSITMILPVEGREEKLFHKLKNANIKGVHVYKKDTIPEKYHMKNDLVLPIVLVADEGVLIKKISDNNKMRPNYSKIFKGSHGYDPAKAHTMRTIFYARGPSIRKGHVSKELKMVDHYNLFCHLLGVQPLPNNGSWDRVSEFLDQAPQAASVRDAATSQHDSSFVILFWISQAVLLLNCLLKKSS